MTTSAPLPPPLEFALRLTALGLLLRPMGPWPIRTLLLIVAGAALLWGPALRASRTWYALAALIGLRIVADWPLADNHIYLLAYWTLAIGLALGAAVPAQVVARSGRWLLAATFLLAVVWKAVLSPDYLDGRFFRVTWLTDPRLEAAVQLAAGFSPDALQASRAALRPVGQGAVLLDPEETEEPARFRWLVAMSTWGAVGIEAAVAVACLLPLTGRTRLVRHVLLLLFCATTYAVAPVAGFGWVLLAIGAALAGSEALPSPWLRHGYAAIWFLVLAYAEVPWAGVLVDWWQPR